MPQQPRLAYPDFGSRDYEAAAQMWLDTGVEPPWYSVWDDGRNVTDNDPSTWPWPYSRYYREGWRPYSGPNANPPSEPGRRPPGMRAQVVSLRRDNDRKRPASSEDETGRFGD